MHRKHFCPESKIEPLFDDYIELRGYRNPGPKPAQGERCKGELPHIKLEHISVYPQSKTS